MYFIIANEKHLKGKGEKHLNEVLQIFHEAGKETCVYRTNKRFDAKTYAEEITSSNDGEHTVVVMGGDGTLHDVLNGFKNFENFSLGLIPFGTGNDFALGSGISKDIRKACEIILSDKTTAIDFIELSSGLRSINSVGTGIDVDVLKRSNAGKSHGKSKYLKSLIASLMKFKSYDFTVCYNGKEEKHFGLIAAIGNGRYLGGGIQLFPDAVTNDGYLDLLIVDYLSKPKIIAAFIKLMRGKVNEIKYATVARTKAVTFKSEKTDFTIQAEGELYDNVPFEAHIVEGKLKFYLPEK